MKRTFFFLGFCLPSIQAGGGASIRTRFCENYFLGIWIFAKPRLICFWILSARRRGLGRNPRGLLDFEISEWGYLKFRQKIIYIFTPNIFLNIYLGKTEGICFIDRQRIFSAPEEFSIQIDSRIFLNVLTDLHLLSLRLE